MIIIFDVLITIQVNTPVWHSLFVLSANQPPQKHPSNIPRASTTAYIVQKLKSSQQRLIKDLGTSDRVKLHYSKRKRCSLILHYPKQMGQDLMKLLVSSLVSFCIIGPVWSYKPYRCIEALLYLGCKPLLEKYITNMPGLRITTKALTHCFTLIVKDYGFHYDSPITSTFFEMFDSKGIPHDFLETFLIHDNKFDINKFFLEIDNLNSQWQQFWQHKSIKFCIYCQLNLTTLKPITRRMEAIVQLVCCGLNVCRSCEEKLSLQPWIQCKSCETILYYNQNKGVFEKDVDENDLQMAVNVNYYRKIQNLPLTNRMDLPWPQSGTAEFGEYLKFNQDSIHQNYRVQKLTGTSTLPKLSQWKTLFFSSKFTTISSNIFILKPEILKILKIPENLQTLRKNCTKLSKYYHEHTHLMHFKAYDALHWSHKSKTHLHDAVEKFFLKNQVLKSSFKSMSLQWEVIEVSIFVYVTIFFVDIFSHRIIIAGRLLRRDSRKIPIW